MIVSFVELEMLWFWEDHACGFVELFWKVVIFLFSFLFWVWMCLFLELRLFLTLLMREEGWVWGSEMSVWVIGCDVWMILIGCCDWVYWNRFSLSTSFLKHGFEGDPSYLWLSPSVCLGVKRFLENASILWVETSCSERRAEDARWVWNSSGENL